MLSAEGVTPNRSATWARERPSSSNRRAVAITSGVSTALRPDTLTRPAEPCSRNRLRSVEPYPGWMPNAAATSPTANPSWVRVTTPMLRMPRSPGSYGPNTTTGPASTTHPPSLLCTLSGGRGVGIPSSKRCSGFTRFSLPAASLRYPQDFHNRYLRESQVSASAGALLQEVWVRRVKSRRYADRKRG